MPTCIVFLGGRETTVAENEADMETASGLARLAPAGERRFAGDLSACPAPRVSRGSGAIRT
jgi:hypothetical protein